MVHPYNGIPLSNKKEQFWYAQQHGLITASYTSNANWEGPNSKGYILWFHLCGILQKAKQWGQRSDQCFPEPGSGERSWLLQSNEGILCDDKAVLYLDCGCSYVTVKVIDCTVKNMTFTVCKLHFHKCDWGEKEVTVIDN